MDIAWLLDPLSSVVDVFGKIPHAKISSWVQKTNEIDFIPTCVAEGSHVGNELYVNHLKGQHFGSHCKRNSIDD